MSHPDPDNRCTFCGKPGHIAEDCKLPRLEHQAAAPAPTPAYSPVRRFERNTMGRDLVVGDIHGHFTRLQAAMELVGFDRSVDRLFSVGDLVDRGPESAAAFEWLREPWFFAVQGNHDDYVVRWAKGKMDLGTYAMNGGAWNINASHNDHALRSAAFARLPVAIEVETAGGLVGIVHADCAGFNWQAFTERLNRGGAGLKNARKHALWSRNRADFLDAEPVAGVRAVVVGHNPVTAPVVLGNVHHIDTKGWKDGHFTLLDLATLAPAAEPGRPVLSWED